MYSIYSSFYNLLYPINNKVSINNISINTEEELPNVTCNSIINPIEEYYINPDVKVPDVKVPYVQVPVVQVPVVQVPYVKVPDIQVPDIQVPVVKVPVVQVPDIQVPDIQVPIDNKYINFNVNNILYNFDMDELELNEIIKIKDIDMSVMLLKAISDLID